MTVSWGRLFGRADQFALDLRIFDAPSSGGRVPDVEEASWTGFALHVDGRNLCAVRDDSGGGETVEWSFFPIAEWFAGNWDAIVHEQRFPLDGCDAGEPAAWAAEQTSRPQPGTTEDEQSRRFEVWQAWWGRHALRAAAPGALVPNVFFRRVGEDVDVSWLNRPFGARYRHFRFGEVAGTAVVPVDHFCSVVHEALSAFADQFPQAGTDAPRIRALRRDLASLKRPFRHIRARRLRYLFGIPEVTLERAGVTARSSTAVAGLWQEAGLPALLFGAVAPRLGVGDLRTLNAELRRAERGRRGPAALDRWVTTAPCPAGEWWDSRRPWQDAYERALALRAALGLGEEPVHIEGLLGKLGVAVREVRLADRSIRGVALASPVHGPTVLVNAASSWNQGTGGRSATLAHEFCHLLLDRDRARRAVVVSGPWAPRRIEQRARAFAAMFLVPFGGLRRMVEEHRGPVDVGLVRRIARHFSVSADLVANHLLNLSDALHIPRDEIDAVLGSHLDPSEAECSGS